MTDSSTKRLILGVGTGRSGTESLACLLDSQPGARVSHEFAMFTSSGERAARHRRPLAWSATPTEADAAIDALWQYEGDIVGDVGSYWLPQVDRLLSSRSDVRVICVSRPEEAVIRSFLAKTQGRNHWMRHDGTQWDLDPIWDPVFPKYDARSIAEAVSQYWREYTGECQRLCQRFPDRFKLCPLEDLNDVDAIIALLGFAGFDASAVTMPAVTRRNRGQKKWRRIVRRIGGWQPQRGNT